MGTSTAGLRGYIWDNTPRKWQIVIEKEKVKQDYIESIYKAIPKSKKGNHWTYGRTWLICRGVLKQLYHLTYTVAPNSKHPESFWKKVVDKISNLEFQMQ